MEIPYVDKYVVFYDNKSCTVVKGTNNYNSLRSYIQKNRIPFNSNALIWRPQLRQWRCVPNIPFYMDVRLPKDFIFMLGESFRSRDIGHELAIYVQTLDWIDQKKRFHESMETNKRKAFWKTHGMQLLLPHSSVVCVALREGWFKNDNAHTFLSSYSLQVLHRQRSPVWHWVKSTLKKKFDVSICCIQKELPDFKFCPSVIIKDLVSLKEVSELVRLSRKYLIWNHPSEDVIPHLYLHMQPSNITINLPSKFHVVHLHHISPFCLYQLFQKSKRIYRSLLLPMTEFLIIGLAVTNAEIVMPGVFHTEYYLDPQF